ncbi:MAG: plastocyanin/azurin family copper-binding protein [Solirubrobacteraceae bacterium]
MRLRRRYVPLLVVLGLAAAVLPALASSETSPTVNAVNTSTGGLYSEEHHSWSPSQVSVGAGGVVTFSNSSEVPHGVEWRSALKPTCEEGAGKVPVGTTAAASATKWSGSCTFSQAGTYTFYCTVHGPEMTGTITVSPDGATTTTMTTNPTTTTPGGPPPETEVLSGSPLVGSPSLRSSQHGTSVHGSLDISKAGAGGRLEVELLTNSTSLGKTKHSTRISVGRFIRSSLPAGQQSFSVKLSAKAKRALNRHHRLALTVRIVLTPLHGKPTTLTRSVIQHG